MSSLPAPEDLKRHAGGGVRGRCTAQAAVLTALKLLVYFLVLKGLIRYSLHLV